MGAAVLVKLFSIAFASALGFAATRRRWLGGPEAARVLANAAFFIFLPGLLFRTAARLDFATLPWRTLVAFFVPVVVLQVSVYLARRREGGAAPGVRAISASFGNLVQVGIPIESALFGEAGLAIHIAIVGLHALIQLSLVTTLVELGLAREAGHGSLARTLATTARNTVVHPAVLPVVGGLAWNALGLPLPALLDEALLLLASAVVPLCLVLIGVSLATFGLRAAGWRGAAATLVLKLVALPALVFAFGHWGLGLAGLPLQVIVVAAALPTGSNALIFAQRYRTQEAEATAAIVLSTLLFVFAVPGWLALANAVG